ncbi:hypothetical protein J2752_001780 [Halarchaeum rubridurum]|uniref:Uncharacterized protein n=1 Tax=Halarchaeum rubridurum TaxID=489911 RepID=A0A830FYF8_9EURY|nr:hypothetical protein [Halarchaeum rubridurum]MBP1954868.1 hypothetical protein [Halarchaeum rubridurum]GGM60376.1 hypothetical protein GCM10009017_08180 [Halarchaeum rubridurum]
MAETTPETVTGTVIHAVPPDDRDDHDLDPALAERADGRYIVVCRRGGSPSLLGRVWSLLRGGSIDAITVVTAEAYEEGDRLDVTAVPTGIEGVYDATEA